MHPLMWRHNGRDGVSNHQPHNCLLNRWYRRRSKKTSKLRVTGLCAGNSPVTGEFPAQKASNAENVSIWWRHHDLLKVLCISYSISYLHRGSCVDDLSEGLLGGWKWGTWLTVSQQSLHCSQQGGDHICALVKEKTSASESLLHGICNRKNSFLDKFGIRSF